MAADLVHLPVLRYVRAELIINCIVSFLVLVVVGLRVVGRRLGPGLGWDDGLILCATPLAIAMLVAHGLVVPLGGGYDIPEHPELFANFTYISQITFVMELVYVVVLSLIKASMLSFLLRAFVTTSLRKAVKAMLAFVVAWMICYLCACIFICNPISAQWTGLGTCGDFVGMIQSLIATNIVSDLAIMSLPMYSVWHLQTRKAEKIAIMSSFALGLAVVVAATARLVYISTALENTNITATLPTIMFLFVLEPNLGILCVSIPMLRPLYSMYRKRMGGSRLKEITDERSGGYANRSGQRSGQRTHIRTLSNSRGDDSSNSNNSNNNSNSNNAAWELEDIIYRPDIVKHDTIVTGPSEDTVPGDESGSEKNLTTTAEPMGTKGGIRVDTVWSLTRS